MGCGACGAAEKKVALRQPKYLSVTSAELHEEFAYDPQTGELRSKKRRRLPAGTVVGNVNDEGYRRVKINGVTVSAHRVIWAMCHGAWPEGEIDHINGLRDDNRILNLRVVTHAENKQNMTRSPSSKSSTPLLGASFHKLSNKWRARVKTNGVSVYLGLFETAEEAHAAYIAKKREMHRTCTL